MTGGADVSLHGKGQKRRTVYIGPELFADLMRLHGDRPQDSPFINLKYSQCLRLVKGAAKAAGIDPDIVAPHRFRHAHASHALQLGATLPEVRDLLGHANISTTCRYAHSNKERATAKKLKIK